MARKASPRSGARDMPSFAKLRGAIRRAAPGGGRIGHIRLHLGALAWVALCAALSGWGLSGVYVVASDQQAFVTRFGDLVGRSGPGLHYRLPAPIEQVQLVDTGRVHLLEAHGSPPAAPTLAGLLPTADKGLAGLDYAVAWRIRDPEAYVLQSADPQAILSEVAAQTMRLEAARRSLSDLFAATGDRVRLQAQAAADMQRSADRLGLGVAILGVRIHAAVLPAEVRAAALDTAAAKETAETGADEADRYRAQVVAAAKLSAAKTLADANAYRDQAIAEAKGAAERFTTVEAAYRKAPALTTDRLYFETLQGVMSRAHVIVVDTPKGVNLTLPPDIVPSAAAARLKGGAK